MDWSVTPSDIRIRNVLQAGYLGSTCYSWKMRTGPDRGCLNTCARTSMPIKESRVLSHAGVSSLAI